MHWHNIPIQLRNSIREISIVCFWKRLSFAWFAWLWRRQLWHPAAGTSLQVIVRGPALGLTVRESAARGTTEEFLTESTDIWVAVEPEVNRLPRIVQALRTPVFRRFGAASNNQLDLEIGRAHV